MPGTCTVPVLPLPVLPIAGVPKRRSRGRGRVVVDRQSQLAVRHRPRQLCRRLHGGNDGSRDRRSDDVTRRPLRLRLRRHLAPRLPAQTGYPVCGEDAAGRRGPSDRVHQGMRTFTSRLTSRIGLGPDGLCWLLLLHAVNCGRFCFDTVTFFFAYEISREPLRVANATNNFIIRMLYKNSY